MSGLSQDKSPRFRALRETRMKELFGGEKSRSFAVTRKARCLQGGEAPACNFVSAANRRTCPWTFQSRHDPQCLIRLTHEGFRVTSVGQRLMPLFVRDKLSVSGSGSGFCGASPGGILDASALQSRRVFRLRVRSGLPVRISHTQRYRFVARRVWRSDASRAVASKNESVILESYQRLGVKSLSNTMSLVRISAGLIRSENMSIKKLSH